jgi:hypothetical protein
MRTAWEIMRLAAHMRHGVVWMACGCNPLTLPLHVAAVEAFYGPRPFCRRTQDGY